MKTFLFIVGPVVITTINVIDICRPIYCFVPVVGTCIVATLICMALAIAGSKPKPQG